MRSERAKILIVEDEREIVDNYLLLFKKYRNLKVVGVAYNGKDAVNIIKNTEPDIIILDIIMKGTDGLEVIKYINSIPNNTIDVIVTSIISNKKIITECFNNGAYYYLLKPFDFEVLIKKYLIF